MLLLFAQKRLKNKRVPGTYQVPGTNLACTRTYKKGPQKKIGKNRAEKEKEKKKKTEGH